MPFDESKDVVLVSKVGIEGAKTRIVVQICSYDGGPKKIQLKRENRTTGDWKFAKLGRMTPQEFVEVMPVGLELLEGHGLLEEVTHGV